MGESLGPLSGKISPVFGAERGGNNGPVKPKRKIFSGLVGGRKSGGVTYPVLSTIQMDCDNSEEYDTY